MYFCFKNLQSVILGEICTDCIFILGDETADTWSTEATASLTDPPAAQFTHGISKTFTINYSDTKNFSLRLMLPILAI